MKTLYTTVLGSSMDLQYESIFDDDIMDKMDEDLVKRRILEYCKYKSNGHCWPAATRNLKVTNVGKDSKGWYIDTESDPDGSSPLIMNGHMATSFLDYCTAPIYKKHNWTDFKVVDYNEPELHFRWRKHKGSLSMVQSQDLDSTDGLPEVFDILQLNACCQQSKKLDIKSKLNVLVLLHTPTINVTGNVKNVVVYPTYDSHTPKVSSRIRVFNPTSHGEYIQKIQELLH